MGLMVPMEHMERMEPTGHMARMARMAPTERMEPMAAALPPFSLRPLARRLRRLWAFGTAQFPSRRPMALMT